MLIYQVEFRSWTVAATESQVVDNGCGAEARQQASIEYDITFWFYDIFDMAQAYWHLCTEEAMCIDDQISGHLIAQLFTSSEYSSGMFEVRVLL